MNAESIIAEYFEEGRAEKWQSFVLPGEAVRQEFSTNRVMKLDHSVLSITIGETAKGKRRKLDEIVRLLITDAGLKIEMRRTTSGREVSYLIQALTSVQLQSAP